MRRLKICSVVLLPALKPACSSAMIFFAYGFNLLGMIFSLGDWWGLLFGSSGTAAGCLSWEVWWLRTGSMGLAIFLSAKSCCRLSWERWLLPLHLLGPVLLGCCRLQLTSLSSMIVLQPPLLCEGWGGYPLCLSGDSSVLMDLHLPCSCTAQSSILSIRTLLAVYGEIEQWLFCLLMETSKCSAEQVIKLHRKYRQLTTLVCNSHSCTNFSSWHHTTQIHHSVTSGTFTTVQTSAACGSHHTTLIHVWLWNSHNYTNLISCLEKQQTALGTNYAGMKFN